MKTKQQLIEAVFQLAKKNIPPLPEHLEIAIKKGGELAKLYSANEDTVFIGICLMDIKLGEAIAEQKRQEHVKMAVDFATEFLKEYDISDAEKEDIINCIEAHHGKIPFQCIEAEICANVDCYRFLSPTGAFAHICSLASTFNNLEDILLEQKRKMDEKYKILSLNKVKEDLEESYQMLNKLINKRSE